MLAGIWFDIASRAHTSLQKQGGCFNHSVVTNGYGQTGETVVMRGLLLVLETNCIRQPKRQLPSSSYNHNTLKTLITSVIPSPGYIKSMKVPYCNLWSAFVMTPSQMF